jgi:VIT1/CCC1 family predicted Fe2+/Mn2+ transporter
MKKSFKTGFCFGVTSGIITTLGLMVGLHSGTHSTLAVIGGVLTIAIADAFSDALGMHISEEAEGNNTKEIWESSIATFFTKLVFALSFVIPVLTFELTTAIEVSVIWGLLLIVILSTFIARDKKENVWKVVLEHLAIALLVIFITHYTGDWISANFSYAKVV